MKVIKKEDTSHWTYKHICKDCDSELEVEAKDLRHTHYDGDFRDPAYDTYSAQCAVCTRTFTVPVNKIPKLIQIEAQGRTQRYSGSGGYFDR
jgi:hypothetical protein